MHPGMGVNLKKKFMKLIKTVALPHGDLEKSTLRNVGGQSCQRTLTRAAYPNQQGIPTRLS